MKTFSYIMSSFKHCMFCNAIMLGVNLYRKNTQAMS